MATVKYTKEHEWIRVEGNIGTVGITDFAQQQLGDVVYVELPEKGKAVPQGGQTAVVESVKAASEIYAPVGGEIAGADHAFAKHLQRIGHHGDLVLAAAALDLYLRPVVLGRPIREIRATMAAMDKALTRAGKPHRYVFSLYALDIDKMDVPNDASGALVGFNIGAHTVGKAVITAQYGR